MSSRRVALVSGAGRGVGAAIAVALAEDGADVAVNYRKDADSAAAVVAKIEALGRRAKAYAASVDRFEEDQAMVESVAADFGRIDILVNNAGIASRGASVERTDPDELDRVLRIHACGSHYLSKLCIPHIKKQERGDIVMISSIATQLQGAGGAPYNMAKSALEALALTLAKEVRQHGIHVNIVAPGLVETEMGRRLVKGAAGIEDISTLHEHSPFGRVCQPEDVANVVRFFVSEQASYLTGERIQVNGGGTAQGGW
jgi:NAD(P)-dependent dehydrogenase (short-subunit alcohol dehydrogenase family)